MASPTPGVLLKLLQTMQNPSTTTTRNITGSDHRPPILQVIGLVPALSASISDSNSLFLPNRGFYLQLSDSLHSTYVALSAADAESLLLPRPQLGQLVTVDRLLLDRPVPRALNLRPLPSAARPLPFLGSPDPLIVHFSQSGFVIQPSNSSDSTPPLVSSLYSSNAFEKENVNANVKNSEPPAVKRRFSSPAGRKNVGSEIQRDPSPAVKRGASPVPSRCAVPSLVVAKEENRKVAREPAIVVPSRYRQPSPVAGRRAAASPVVGARRLSMSPAGRRLSSGEGGGKKKVVAGISKMTDVSGGVVMVKAGRKSWDKEAVEVKEKEKSSGRGRSKVDKDATLRTQVMNSSA